MAGETSPSMDPLAALPEAELRAQVLMQLSSCDKRSAALVCRAWHAAVSALPVRTLRCTTEQVVQREFMAWLRQPGRAGQVSADRVRHVHCNYASALLRHLHWWRQTLSHFMLYLLWRRSPTLLSPRRKAVSARCACQWRRPGDCSPGSRATMTTSRSRQAPVMSKPSNHASCSSCHTRPAPHPEWNKTVGVWVKQVFSMSAFAGGQGDCSAARVCRAPGRWHAGLCGRCPPRAAQVLLLTSVRTTIRLMLSITQPGSMPVDQHRAFAMMDLSMCPAGWWACGRWCWRQVFSRRSLGCRRRSPRCGWTAMWCTSACWVRAHTVIWHCLCVPINATGVGQPLCARPAAEFGDDMLEYPHQPAM